MLKAAWTGAEHGSRDETTASSVALREVPAMRVHLLILDDTGGP
jgi:hypothetical protein